MQFTDTHCHLNFTSFDDDRLQVIERARQAGVLHILNPGIDLESSLAAVQLSEQFRELYSAVGVHPNEGGAWTNNALKVLRELAVHPGVVAIGEIGLDYYRDRAPRKVQQAVFREQLELAGELGLPVVIHNRQAGEDLIRILEEWCQDLAKVRSGLAERPGVLHSFSEDLAFARKAIELKFRIGITGPVTFKNAASLHALVAGISLEWLLIETDAPFLTPHPHRGQRNEPVHVRLIADKIAAVREQAVEVVAAATSQNAARLFLW